MVNNENNRSDELRLRVKINRRIQDLKSKQYEDAGASITVKELRGLAIMVGALNANTSKPMGLERFDFLEEAQQSTVKDALEEYAEITLQSDQALNMREFLKGEPNDSTLLADKSGISNAAFSSHLGGTSFRERLRNRVERDSGSTTAGHQDQSELASSASSEDVLQGNAQFDPELFEELESKAEKIDSPSWWQKVKERWGASAKGLIQSDRGANEQPVQAVSDVGEPTYAPDLEFAGIGSEFLADANKREPSISSLDDVVSPVNDVDERLEPFIPEDLAELRVNVDEIPDPDPDLEVEDNSSKDIEAPGRASQDVGEPSLGQEALAETQKRQGWFARMVSGIGNFFRSGQNRDKGRANVKDEGTAQDSEQDNSYHCGAEKQAANEDCVSPSSVLGYRGKVELSERARGVHSQPLIDPLSRHGEVSLSSYMRAYARNSNIEVKHAHQERLAREDEQMRFNANAAWEIRKVVQEEGRTLSHAAAENGKIHLRFHDQSGDYSVATDFGRAAKGIADIINLNINLAAQVRQRAGEPETPSVAA